MTNKQKRFFSIAKEISKLSDYKTHVGAIVVEKNRVISSGHNASKTSTLQKKYNQYRNFLDNDLYLPKIHAEIAALAPLLKQDIDWSKTSIYTYRELKDGTISCARPCPACMKLIRELGIRHIFYTDWDSSYSQEELLKEN